MAIMMGVVPLMDHMGQDPKILGYAREYYTIMVYSLAPFVIFYVIRALTEGVGNTKYTMYITVFCNILNIFLNWVLIFGHFGIQPMGVAGAAWATFISRCAMMGIGIAILLSGRLYKKYLGNIRLSALNFKQFKESHTLTSQIVYLWTVLRFGSSDYDLID